MQKCYAVFRMQPFEYSGVRSGVGGIIFRGGVGEFACDLGDLTDLQLEELKKELKNRIGEEPEIRINEKWDVDRNERDIIFLIQDSYLDDADRIALEDMEKQYERKIEAGGAIAEKLISLRHCIKIAESIRKPQSPHIKRPGGYQEPTDFVLADLKPPCEENGRWFSVGETEKILNDILILKKTEELRNNIPESKNPEDIVNEIEKLRTKQLLAKSTLRTRREGVISIQDKQTRFWHGQDTEGVFFRFARKNRTREYFILLKKDDRFLNEYPRLVDSASDTLPPEVKFLKIMQK